MQTHYDVVIIGGGHNGLVAAGYLAKAGMSVLVLERNSELGGATRSKRIFPGMNANLSVYSYLISLLPEKIVDDLGLKLQLRSRKTASYSSVVEGGRYQELLLRNGSSGCNREAFLTLNRNERDFRGFLELQEMQQRLAEVIWPSLTEPLVSRKAMRERFSQEGMRAWQALIEEPLGVAIESLISSDLIRGLIFTDAKIGVSTFPHDPSLLQNRTFLYHVIGRGTGEWRVPVGGMGALTYELVRVACETGRVTYKTHARAHHITPGKRRSSVSFELDGINREVDARFVLCNASAQVLAELTDCQNEAAKTRMEGSVFKINMLLERLPRLRSQNYSATEAFAGTFHIDEGYQQMISSYRESTTGKVPQKVSGEIYCHTLTDDSILSDDLKQRGFHTLTLFGLDMPYQLFANENEQTRKAVLAKYLEGLNRYLEEPIEQCLARDSNDNPCIDAMSPVDLEEKIHLPKGNIFHGDLTWPFTDCEAEVGDWGVETSHSNILLCGSAAHRGGAVSGIPGHNAAMCVLEKLSDMK